MSPVTHAPRRFATTRWSVVVAAGGDDSAARDALAELCGGYWYPLYAFARHGGRSHADAADLTQGFFAELLAKSWVKSADRDRGRFRTFLRTAFRRYLGHERDRDAALKRGGGAVGRLGFDPDFAAGDRRFARESTDGMTADALFERRWALSVLDRVLARLTEEHADGERRVRFEALRPRLTGTAAASYVDLAEQLGMTEGAVKVAVHRLRSRYRALLREEVAGTLADAGEVEDELRALKAALSS